VVSFVDEEVIEDKADDERPKSVLIEDQIQQVDGSLNNTEQTILNNTEQTI
jgi:hypothetical protein